LAAAAELEEADLVMTVTAKSSKNTLQSRNTAKNQYDKKWVRRPARLISGCACKLCVIFSFFCKSICKVFELGELNSIML